MAGPKRRKIAPRAINRAMPAWAVRLVNEGIAPREGEDGSAEWFGWLYCGDAVPGLPSSDSPEGQRLWSDALKPAEELGARRLRHPARRHRTGREGPGDG
jgi:hypothetical protein